MSSAHPDSGLPAPAQHEVPLSAEEATRLLDSIRQAEDELAETGENIAVAPAGDVTSPAGDVTAPANEVTAPAAEAEPEPAATESDDSGVVAADDPEPVFGAAVAAAEQFAAAPARAEATAEPVESVTAEAVEPASAEAVESAPVAFSSEIVVEVDPQMDESVASEADVAVADTEVPAPASGTGGGLILPGDVAGDVETIVHVMRHGEVHNPNGVLYGRLPGFQLSVTGRAQAQAVARSLADHEIGLVVASPLQRAQETADPIAKGHGLIIRTDDNLIEAGNTFEGLRVSASDGALRKPRHWWKLRDPFTPSWGEPYLQIAHRMLAAVNKARVEAAGREAVLVSHQLPVWTLRRFLQGQRLWHDPRNRQCSLASLTSLVYQGDTLIDIVYSEPAGASDPTVTGA